MNLLINFRARQRGFSLIEVLVSVLILAIGLLGLAALQVRGLRNSQMSLQRSMATQLAYDIADRMRANPAGLSAGSYNNGTAGTDACLCEQLEPKSTTCPADSLSSVPNPCTAANLAAYDLKQWNDALAAKLAGGKGVVCLDDSPNDGTSAAPACAGSANGIYAIKVFWSEQVESSTTSGVTTSQESRFVTTFQP